MAVRSDGRKALCSLPAARYGKNRNIPLRRVSPLTECSTASALSEDELGKHHRSYLVSVWSSQMATPYTAPSIDEYLRKRLMPVEGAIPYVQGIEMYGNSIPAGTVGGDLFEYINFQQRYDIDARIQRAVKLSKEFLEPLRAGEPPRNSVDDHVGWLQSKPGFRTEMETEYRTARSSEQVRVAEDLHELYTTAGVLLVDAQGHGIISAKIASTVHDTFHALMLAELDRRGKITPELFEKLNLRLAQSVTARNALGRSEDESSREIATMLYGELRPNGHFRFVNFGHPPPLVFSAEYRQFMEIDKSRMVNSAPLGRRFPTITRTILDTFRCILASGRLRLMWPRLP